MHVLDVLPAIHAWVLRLEDNLPPRKAERGTVDAAARCAALASEYVVRLSCSLVLLHIGPSSAAVMADKQAVDEPVIPLAQLNAGGIDIHGAHFLDHYGRILHLRGANVGASSKV